MIRPTRTDPAGRAYLDLQNQAHRQHRGTQDLLTLYVLERFLARLAGSPHVSQFGVQAAEQNSRSGPRPVQRPGAGAGAPDLAAGPDCGNAAEHLIRRPKILTALRDGMTRP